MDLSSHRKEGNPAIMTIWISLGDIMLSEISQTQKNKFCMILLICRILKSQTHRTSRIVEDKEIWTCWSTGANFQL